MKTIDLTLHLWESHLQLPLQTIGDAELKMLSDFAYSWKTCAFGTLDVVKDDEGIPMDEELRQLGKDFHNKGIAWMSFYVIKARETVDEDLKDVRFSLAEDYKVQALDIIQKIKKKLYKD